MEDINKICFWLLLQFTPELSICYRMSDVVALKTSTVALKTSTVAKKTSVVAMKTSVVDTKVLNVVRQRNLIIHISHTYVV